MIRQQKRPKTFIKWTDTQKNVYFRHTSYRNPFILGSRSTYTEREKRLKIEVKR